MKINWGKIACQIITFRQHWWKHYPGQSRYVRCRLCGRLPKNMWDWYIEHKMKGEK